MRTKVIIKVYAAGLYLTEKKTTMADIATIGILQERAIRRGEVLSEQLQAALISRVVLEQAKGVVAHVGKMDMADAFKVLRRYARDHNLRLTAVAETVVNRSLHVQDLLDNAEAKSQKSR